MPLLRLRAAPGRRRPSGARAQDRAHPRAARLGRTGHRPAAVGPARTRRHLASADAQAREIDEASDERLEKTAVAEMDDETAARRARQAKELDDLRETPRGIARAGRRRSGDAARRSSPRRWRAPAPRSKPRGTARSTASRSSASIPTIPPSSAGGWAEALDDLQNPPPQAIGEAEGLARRRAAARRLVPTRTDRRRRRCRRASFNSISSIGSCAGCCRAS